MIAPDAQRHPVAGIGQTQLAIRFLLARNFWRGGFDLHMDSGGDRAPAWAGRSPPYLAQRHQLHVDFISSSSA
jgi:hypothetical protein